MKAANDPDFEASYKYLLPMAMMCTINPDEMRMSALLNDLEEEEVARVASRFYTFRDTQRLQVWREYLLKED
jgi:hypothetical protein